MPELPSEVQKRELKTHSLLCAECWKAVPVQAEVALHDVYLQGSGQMCNHTDPGTGRPCWEQTRLNETTCRNSGCARFGRPAHAV